MSIPKAQPFGLMRWLLVAALALVAVPAWPVEALPPSATNQYDNPLEIVIPGGGLVESCADPDIIRGQQPGDTFWYMFCTTDPLNGADRDANGNLIFHFIPMLRSADLVNWTYVGDAFAARPGWVADDAGLWAPEVAYFNDQYYLYYTASWTDLPGGGSAIGVATSDSPLGPWVDSGAPAVEPHAPACCPFDKRWTFDADVITWEGQRYIYYGSYFDGISVLTLSADGLTSDPASQAQVTIANRYEGAHVVEHDGYLYLLASATDCCRGPLTGYSVFAGRSTSPTGPFVDREGNALLAGRVGGTPVISMNGNRWVGTGHNAVFVDMAGQYWTVYHAIDRFDPYFAGTLNFTKRPVLLDPIDWVDGWPTVRGGEWASDREEHGPAAQPGDLSHYQTKLVREHRIGKAYPELSDEFDGASLGPQWSWVREPGADAYALEDGTFRFDTQPADLFEGSNNASVLVEAAPKGDWVVETRVRLNLPAEGCCFNYVQAGLVVYGNDDNFVKLVHVSIWETRQTEWAKEWFPVPDGYPRYGNTVVGAPGEWTYLRIVKETRDGEEHYTAYTSTDGSQWVRGGVWTHQLGEDAQIGLVAMGGSGFVANFDYVRMSKVN